MSAKEFSQVTTRGGDEGESSLADGERRRKDDLLFETLGGIDELVSHLGLLRAAIAAEAGPNAESDPGDKSVPAAAQGEVLLVIQRRLQTAAGMVAVPKRSDLFTRSPRLGEAETEELEEWERKLMEDTTIAGVFVQPGADILSAQAHLSRTVCRRSERRVVSCIRDRNLSHLSAVQRYLNRLSDYLFVLALWLEQSTGRKR
jgi:cob(I)alamin adenosyltransferase